MKQILLTILVFIPASLFAQNSINTEIQAYPAGIIPTVRFDYNLSFTSYLTTRIGYNFTNRQDFGKNDNEEGGGPGFSLGYAKTDFLTENLGLNLRTDLWFMDIDWRDAQTICGIVPPCDDVTFSGTSEIMVLQPTIGLDYNIPLSEKLFLEPSLSFGYEINIKTNGREVGEGAILLGGLNLGYEF